MLSENVLPIDSSVRTWRSSVGGQAAKGLEQALLLPVDMEH